MGIPPLKSFFGSLLSSAVGDGCFHITMSVVAYDLGGDSAGAVGLAWLIRTLPYFIALPLVSPLVDRLPRRQVMRMADLARCGLLTTLAGLYFMDELVYGMFATLIFFKSFGDIMHQAARDAWVTQQGEAEDRVKLNSLVQGGHQGGLVAGMLLAGWVLHRTMDSTIAGGAWLLAVDAVSFLMSALFLGWAANPPRPEAGSSASFLSWSQWRELFQRVPLLPWILAITAVDNFFIMGPALVGAPALIHKEMALDWDYFATYEVLITAVIGAVALILYAWPPKRLLTWIGIALFVDGITHLPFLLCRTADDFHLLLIFVGIHAIAIPLLMVPRTTWIQEYVPEHFQGRIFAAMSTLVLGITGLSSALTGWAIDQGGWRSGETFFWGGVGAACCGLVACWRFRRSATARPRPGN